MFSLFKEKSFNFHVMFISLALVVYPATVLSVPKINGLIFILFTLFGLFVFFKYRKQSILVSGDERKLYFSLALFFFVSLFITVYGGFAYKAIGKYLHLLLIIPIYIYLRHFGVRQNYIWFGLVVGAIAAAGVAINDVFILNSQRARSLTHPIIFGDLSLVLGCMSIAGLGWFKKRGNWQMVYPVVALLCGMLASMLSLSRGGWVAFPFIILVFFWYIQPYFSNRKKAIFAAVVIVGLGAIYAVPQTQVRYQIDRTINSLQQYSDSAIDSEHRATSVGGRLEMWQAAWKIFTENPVLGIGWGHYNEQVKLQVAQGLRNEFILTFDHPHNEYLSALSNAGMVGFTVLMVLFLTPLWIFVKNIRREKSLDVQRLALAGLVLIVAYMGFGISEPMLFRSRSVNFFALYLAVFMAAIYTQKNRDAGAC